MLEKVTWGLVTFVLVVSIISSFTLGGKSTKGDITDKVETTNTAPDFGQSEVLDLESPTENTGN